MSKFIQTLESNLQEALKVQLLTKPLMRVNKNLQCNQ